MSTATATAAAAITVQTFRSPEGCVAYLIADEASRTALALDPRLDQVDLLAQALAARGLRLTHVLDTHTPTLTTSRASASSPRAPAPPCWPTRHPSSTAQPGAWAAARASRWAPRP